MPTEDFDYDAALVAIRGHFTSIAEHKFQIAALVRAALDAGISHRKIATDVNQNWHTLRKTLKVAEFWGDERMPGKPQWSDYTMVFAQDYNTSEQAQIKTRLLAGEWPHAVYADYRDKAYRRSVAGRQRERWNHYKSTTTWLDHMETYLGMALSDLEPTRKNELQEPTISQVQRVGELVESVITICHQIGIPVQIESPVPDAAPTTATSRRRRWGRAA